mgnify:CR=1 FL=1
MTSACSMAKARTIGQQTPNPESVIKYRANTILLGMKLTCILIVVACLQVSAKGFGQGTVTLSMKDVPVTDVFREIESKHHLGFCIGTSW